MICNSTRALRGSAGDADGGADVAAGFAEDFDEEVRGAVDHGWGIGEAGDGVDVAVDGDDRFYGVERAEMAFEDGEMHEGAGAGGGVGFGDGFVGTGSAGDDAVGTDGDYAGEVDHVADCFCGDIVSAGRGKRRQGDSKLLQASFCSGGHDIAAFR